MGPALKGIGKSEDLPLKVSEPLAGLLLRVSASLGRGLRPLLSASQWVSRQDPGPYGMGSPTPFLPSGGFAAFAARILP